MTSRGAQAEPDLPEFLWGSDEPSTSAPPPASSPARSQAGHIPGEAGLWIFILGDMTLFGALMLVFLWERRSDPLAFRDSAHHLIQPIGAANTLVLLFSSYLVVRALTAHRNDRHAVAKRSVTGAIVCAAIFVILKAAEYSGEIASGHTPSSGLFFTFYFVLTGLHLLHVLVGTAILLVWRKMLGRHRRWTESPRLAEGFAIYWHMVDLLWVAIFALVYLVSAE